MTANASVGYQWPCGSWPSPVSASMVAAGGTRISGPAARSGSTVGDSGEIWWLEGRPTEAGRYVLVCATETGTHELPAPWSVRTAVHEYGGGAFWLGRSSAYFTNWSDQRLYRVPVGEDGLGTTPNPKPVTGESPSERAWRYADGREHPVHDYVVCVFENHEDVGADAQSGKTAEPTNTIVAIVVDGSGERHTLVEGTDFVSTPRVSPDGRWLSWIQWDHPNMPWNETTLCAAPLFGGPAEAPRLGNSRIVASGNAIHGADWTSDGRLVYSTDASGFWNLAWWSPTGGSGALTSLRDGEIGLPSWGFGTQQWSELADGRLVVVITREASDSLAILSDDGLSSLVEGNSVDDQASAMTAIGLSGSGSTVVATLARTTVLPEILTIDVDQAATSPTRTVRPPDAITVGREWLSEPTSIWFDSDSRPTQCFFYPPSPVGGQPGDAESSPTPELPPLIVLGHGGPTGHSGPDLHLRVQFWTSRGFAVADVNYGGSSGFGTDYRARLDGNWGVLDVDDCVAAARHLADTGLVDGARMAIRGGSAGGLTVMNALITSNQFQAGTSLYGVADLAALATETHKFESRYLDRLVGPYPEAANVYADRSPINHTEKLSAPMLVLQGSEDAVVPPQQSRNIVAALEVQGIAHAYIEFDGEQHGFRQAKNIIRSLEAELWFYGRVFGFEPADEIEPPELRYGLDGA